MSPARTDARSLLFLSLFLLLFTGSVTLVPAQDESANQGNISTSVGLNTTSAYYFRGIDQEGSGLIFQPSVEVGTTLYEGEDVTLSGNAGLWWSIHTAGTGDASTADGRSRVYEEDVYAGLNLSAGNWSLGTSYIFFTSPNDAFATIEELDLSVSYDDSEALGDYALSPYVMVGFETDNHSGADEATYVELGVSPGTTLNEKSTYPVSVSFPVTIGLSGDDYYEDPSGDEETLGYIQFGPHASVPLAKNTQWGSLSLSGGVDYLFIGPEETANGGDSSEFLANISLNLSY